MKFRTAFSEPLRFSSPSGSPHRTVYQRKVSSSGKRSLVESGIEPVHQLIQEAARGNTVKDILSRFNAGDTSALGVDSNSYADISNAPQSLLDAELSLIKAHSIYDSLPSDVKSRYDNDFETFLSSVDSGAFMSNEFALGKSQRESSAAIAEVNSNKEKKTWSHDELEKFIQEKMNV